MTNNTLEGFPELGSAIARSRKWMITIGIILIIAGIAAISFPMISSYGVEVIVGMMLLLAGFVQGVEGFSFPKWQGKVLMFISSALWVFAGLYLLTHPLEGLFALTIIVAFAFLAEGVLKTIFAFQLRPVLGWGWALFDGIIALVLGVMLMTQLPFSALWALGTLVGINILLSGFSLVMIAMAVGKVFDQGNA